MKIFVDTYSTVHRLETGKLRNVGKFFAHLLFTDAIDWSVLSVIKLNEDDTTSRYWKPFWFMMKYSIASAGP